MKKLLQSTAVLRKRVQYLCDFLYQGCSIKFARELGLDGWHFRRSMRYGARFTPAMLAQIVLKTNIRADWLLCGVGPVFTDNDAAASSVVLPRAFKSAFSALDTSLLASIPRNIAVVPSSCDAAPLTPAHSATARAVAAARGADKPVSLFVGREALLAGARSPVSGLLQRRYITAVTMTAAAVSLEIPQTATCDHGHIAKLGALAGFGHGEALLRWGQFPDYSIPACVQKAGVPFTVQPLFGEIPQHYQAGAHGAELGACFGAVAYVDLLIFAEHIRKFFGAPGGVFIALGDAHRAGELFLRALAAAKEAQREIPYSGVSFVLIDDEPAAHLEHLVQCAGVQFHFLQGDPAATAQALLHACDAVFEGTSVP